MTDLEALLQSDFENLLSQTVYTRNEILSPRRQSELVDARQFIAKGLRAKGYSFPKIGKVMNRDHTSIQNLVKWR
jgi:chromosomal replication initiation ATPase DnaA